MFVRTATARDLPAIRALLVETWHDTYDAIFGHDRVVAITDEWHSLRALEARLSLPNSEFLVADDGKQIGGVAFASMESGSKVVTLFQLYVRPSLQRAGNGIMLLDEVESCFPDADRVRLEVEQRNEKAVGFYLAQGFSQVGTANNAEAGSGGMLILERPILWAD